MKEFVVYTGLRVLLLAAAFGIVAGVWSLVADEFNVGIAFAVAFVLSGLGSYFLLDRQREAFAQRVEARAARATAAFEQMKAKEDVD